MIVRLQEGIREDAPKMAAGVTLAAAAVWLAPVTAPRKRSVLIGHTHAGVLYI